MSDTAAIATEVAITRARFDGVAFDLDGVLTNTALVHETAWKRVFNDYLERHSKLENRPFIPFSSSDYRNYVDGRSRDDGIRTFVAARGFILPEGTPDDGPDRDTVQGLSHRKNALFIDFLEHDGAHAYPHTVPLLQRLRAAGFKTAVISASKNCAEVLRAAGITELFDVRVDGLDRERLGLRGKPAPDTFLEAARRLGTEPCRIMVVEDALAGVEAGHAGGFGLVVGVNRDDRPDNLGAHGADVVVSDLSKIQVRKTSRAYSSTLSTRRKKPRSGPTGALLPSSESALAKPDSKGQKGKTDPWALSYQGFDPALEGRREALFTLGNGYFSTRGAAAEAVADGVHYPGTYLAGGYNRLTSEIAGHTIEHEDLVNWPNWLPLSVRLDEADSDWFSPGSMAERLQYHQELDLRRGFYRRTVRLRAAPGHVIRLKECRLVHLRERHLAALRIRVTAEKGSTRVIVRSALDGRITNSGVQRYQPFNGRHIEILEAAAAGPDTILIEAQATQSQLRLAEAARTRLYRYGQLFEPERRVVHEPGLVGHEMSFELAPGESVDIEKIVSVYTSRDRASAGTRLEAVTSVARASRFAELAKSHTLAWLQLWRRCGLGFVEARNESDHHTHRLLRLHIFHLLQSVSPHTIDLDTGTPARGWTGEGYRGHIFWDELFIFPFLNHRLPKLTRALLLYRWRRLPEARWAAREAGYRGAMFPWQSGSNGREETDTMFLNPRSGRWINDNTRLQRHVNAAIAYNTWQYYRATDDHEFLYVYGAEIMLEIARFWSSIAQWNPERGRYEICDVMGPDEFHDAYPEAKTPGLKNNAYTNFMAAWCIEHALHLFDLLPDERCRELCETLRVSRAERDRWQDISRKMFMPFHDDGIISQFEGYEQLEEFDWKTYQRRYGNLMRLDLILEAEGDTPNRYKLSKQADVLMLFYLFSAEALVESFTRLGYSFNGAMIPKNIDYYLRRTSHGSTLSGVVHAWVLSRSNRSRSWDLFKQALHSDFSDIQDGTTAEGLHLGAMAGTVDLIQRCYTGLELRGDELWLNPALPEALSQLRFQLRHRGHSLQINITGKALSVASAPTDTAPIIIRCKGIACRLSPGEAVRFLLSAFTADGGGGSIAD